MEKYNFFVLILISIGTVVLSETCPQNKICVPIDHCSSVNEKLYQRNLSDSEINYIRSLKCGFHDNKIYVCCTSSLPQPGICGKVGSEPRIVNGKQTGLGQYPFAVLIGRRWKEANNKTGIAYECGGSLINDRYVLTAAHCVKFLNYTNYKEYIKTIEIVKLGEWNTETDPDENDGITGDPVVKAVVEKIIPHENYRINKKKFNDIALLRLKDKISFTKYINPICLPNEHEKFYGDLIVIGWGKTNSSKNDLETIQRFAKINIVDNERCNKTYNNYKIRSTQICAGSFGKDSCNGDSGGPLIGFNSTNKAFYWYLGGIVSFGSRDCGTIGQPGVYTDVRKYVGWIQQNIIH